MSFYYEQSNTTGLSQIKDNYPILDISNENAYASDMDRLDGRSVIDPQGKSYHMQLPSINQFDFIMPSQDSKSSHQSTIRAPRTSKKHKSMSSFTTQKVTFPMRCQSCQSTETPEWRKGPFGPRTLCNACGLSKFEI
ncbi:hypothetical protein G6F46_002166 [Rhizopus delemar]|uniref:GATA-type domain-containing protein n=2 Tax=Rhizopus TaxID=4842 RepID=A0A9P6ZDS1_9FUNG|nr:hypothetical protein G6F43_003444 [Rhizopus delemar]KAG1552152.1 hypothetical protein G6F51_001402 [Rhizopus arrhizus]KAG1458705.1 hypothetical protein G6F55_005188 [Rhizopus delemar]KAG1500441.1 hypothetical protein G6F54_003715 [Rhizopus delemar]KAG1517738.1 hypothetical protein G6F53_001137 [Rhizopus delemar]